MSQRTQQIESLLKRAIAQVLQRGLDDPRVDALVSVTRVSVSPDLHQATVYVTVLPENKTAKNIAGLQSASRHVGLALRKLVDLRIIPRLHFKADEALKRENAVLDSIRKAMERTEAHEDPSPGEEARDQAGQQARDPATEPGEESPEWRGGVGGDQKAVSPGPPKPLEPEAPDASDPNSPSPTA